MVYRVFHAWNTNGLVGVGLNESLWGKSLVGFALNRLKIIKTIVLYRIFHVHIQNSLVGRGLNEPLWDKNLLAALGAQSSKK